MPAIIRITSGISAGAAYGVDRPVLRIGSDPSCEICLPMVEIPAQAVTLEFRDGGYNVYNRGGVALGLANAALNPGGRGRWGEGESLELPAGVRLLMEYDGDPRPAPQMTPREVETPYAELLAEQIDNSVDAKAAKSKTLTQLAIIGACVVAGALMIFGKPATPTAVKPPEFDALITTLLKDEAFAPLRTRLQAAQTALVRGNKDLARERFGALRDALVAHPERLVGEANAPRQSALSYVEYRLGSLR